MTFKERCQWAWQKNQSLLCVGLDPEPGRLPRSCANNQLNVAVELFCMGIVDATAPYCCAFKPQIAHFAALGLESTLESICRHIKATHPDHLLILDAKRGDIGSTARNYAKEAFERYCADAVTLSPYMGGDSLSPFLDFQDKGIFLLCRTSNPGGDDLQMLALDGGERLFERVARLANERWNHSGQVGLVVGATYPAELAKVRAIAPDLPLLVPGIGAQGGDLNGAVTAGRDANRQGLFINSSRAILYASGQDDWAQRASDVAHETRDAIAASLLI
jgi:orotidine-5'-phosphate decarboxylase